jgi:hypothetical protein
MAADGSLTWQSGAGSTVGTIKSDYASTGDLLIGNPYGNVHVTVPLSGMVLRPDGSYSTEVARATRWIGAMNTGPPVSATTTYTQGDWITARNGVIWFCIAGGTPGTWVPIGSGLPAPVTTGTTVQSYTDPMGEVWVAKNGVNAGAWRKARDVLHAYMNRAGAFTITTANQNVPYDTVGKDDYGMYSAASVGFVAPVAGWYRVGSGHAWNPTAAGHWCNISVQGAASNCVAASGIQSPLVIHAITYLAASAVINVTLAASASFAMGGGSANNYAYFDYLGSG